MRIRDPELNVPALIGIICIPLFLIILLINGIRSCSTQTPTVPTGVIARAESSTSITIRWNAVTRAKEYQVFRNTITGAGVNFPHVSTVTSTSFTDTGLLPNTTYYYIIHANNSTGRSHPSSVSSATTSSGIPAAPSGVVATAVSSSSITVRWNAVSGATEYRVYRNTSSSGTFTRVGVSTSTSLTFTGLSADTTYYFRVSAYNSAGESSQSSSVSATTTTSQQQQNTSFDQASTITTGTTTNASLQANVSHYYRVQLGAGTLAAYTTGNTDTKMWLYGSNRNQLVEDDDSGTNMNARISRTVSAGTYFIRVGGYGSTSGAYTLYVSLEPTQNQNALPATPTGVTATAASSSSITVRWNAVSGATGYQVFRNTTYGGTYTYAETVTSTSFTDTGLLPNTTYYYMVLATNGAGRSPQSSIDSATTNSLNVQSLPSQPSLVENTWNRSDNDGRRYTMTFTRDKVTILIRNKNGSTERDEGDYTLRGDDLTFNFGGYTERYIYSQGHIVNRSNQTIIFTPQQ